MKKDKKKSSLCKIVYFDEDSVTDYIQIVAGGKLEKTTELLNETNDKGNADVEAKTGIGIGGILKALMGFEVTASVDASLETSFNTNKMAKNIVKNTILTDFIDIIESTHDSEEAKNVICNFTGYEISAPEGSFSYVALISPYFSMFKGGSSIPAGDFNIAVEKLDNTIKSAKGYYEFLGKKDKNSYIFRFNINSFKNNYKATDLLKMDLSLYAIKVGTSSIKELDINNELNIDPLSTIKDNPTYIKDDMDKQSSISDDRLDIYDVLLAGVESDD